MSTYKGVRAVDSTVYFEFDSTDAAGSSITVSDFVAGDVEIYKDGSTTQRSSDAGITIAVDFDSSTGLHHVAIDLSDNTDAGFYASGSHYQVAVGPITVNGETRRFWLGSFDIGSSNDDLATDIATVDTNVDAILVDTGTTIPAQITALNNISVADILTTQMTESYAANGVAPTLAQALFAIHQMLMDFSISGTSLTVEQLGGTTAFTVTLDDATNPTSANRA